MAPIDLSQLGLAASRFAIALATGVASLIASERIRSLLRAYQFPEQFYLDICEEFMELRWVRTLGDHDFDSLLRFLCTEATAEQWAGLIREGKLDQDSLIETFHSVGGNPDIFDALFDSFHDLIIRKLQSVMPEEFRLLSVIVVSQGQELRRDIKELRDGLIQASLDRGTRTRMKGLPTTSFDNYLANLKARFYQRWNVFVDMLGERIKDDASPVGSRQIFEPEIRMVLSEFYKKSSPVEHRIPVNTARAVRETHRAVLLGEPGSGKTTLLEKLAYEFASEALANGNKVDSVPIYINLGGFVSGKASRTRRKTDSFYHFILQETEPYMPIPLLNRLLSEGRVVFLLDGLNEMPRADYVRQCYEIRQFVEHFANNRFVIACREADYLDIFRTCEKLIILSLNEHQIKQFAHTYLGEEQGGFLRELQDSSSRFRDLARNPYMLMVMIGIFAYRGHLPETRAQMLKIFIEALLEKALLRGEVFDTKEVYSLLADLASFMANEGLLGSKADVGWVYGWWFKKHHLGKRDALNRLLDVTSVAGILLVPPERQSLQFNHQLLQEYLAVTVLHADLFCGDDWRSAESRSRFREMSSIQYTANLLPYHPRQVQIIRLLASFVTARQAISLLEELVETNIFLARAIGREMEPSVAQQVFNHWLSIASSPSSTFGEWQEAVRMLQSVQGPYATDALITLSLNFALMRDVEPYLKQTVTRAIKSIEMGHQDSLELA